MQYRFFIGIDVSKEYLDAALLDSESASVVNHCKVSNSDTGITELLQWLRQHDGFALGQSVFYLQHTGGSSIRGKTRASHMANKKIKCNLHMVSLTAIKYDNHNKSYYKRKPAEGKSKMSVLNAIRNKLLSRIFAVVERGTVYQKSYLIAS